MLRETLSGHTTLTEDGPLAILTMQHAPQNLLGPALLNGVLDALAAAQRAGARAVHDG